MELWHVQSPCPPLWLIINLISFFSKLCSYCWWIGFIGQGMGFPVTKLVKPVLDPQGALTPLSVGKPSLHQTLAGFHSETPLVFSNNQTGPLAIWMKLRGKKRVCVRSCDALAKTWGKISGSVHPKTWLCLCGKVPLESSSGPSKGGNQLVPFCRVEVSGWKRLGNLGICFIWFWKGLLSPSGVSFVKDPNLG
jgi:hypothetical protein